MPKKCVCFSHFLTVDLERKGRMCPPHPRLWSDWEGSWSPSAEGTPGVTRESWQWLMISLMSMCPPRCYFASLDHIIYIYTVFYTGLQQGQNVHVDVLRMESYSASCCMNVHAIASGQDKIRQRKAESKRSNPSVWERVTLTPKATVMFWDSLHSEYVKSGVDHLARALREEDFSWLSGYSFKRSSHKCRGRSTNN